MFEPVTIGNIFDEEDLIFLRMVIDGKTAAYKSFYDENCKREVLQSKALDEYFGKKLEPLARKLFRDETLRSTFVVYAKYDHPESFLPVHKDRHACVYNMSYCLTQEKPWYFNIDGRPYYMEENELIAYSGTDSEHGRDDMGSSGNSEVEMVFFHFAPSDYWYFEHCEDFRLDYEHVSQSN